MGAIQNGNTIAVLASGADVPVCGTDGADLGPHFQLRPPDS